MFGHPSRRGGRGGGPAGERLHLGGKLVEPGERGAGGGEGVEGEVERLAVVRGDEDVADFAAGVALGEQVAQGVEVAERLGHLFAVHAQVRAVHPAAHEGLAGGGLRLRDFVFVVREEVVDAAGVQVETFAQILHRHGAALDVPAGAAGAPRGIPLHGAVRFVPRLPEREVADRILGVFVVGDADAGAQARSVEVRERAVGGELRDGKIDALVGRLVGDALLEQFSDERDHLRDVVRRGRVNGGGGDGEGLEVFEEGVFEALRVVAQRDARGARIADRLVVHVREVHHVRELVAGVFERAVQHVLERVGAEVADVREVVNRGAAGVEAGDAGFKRLERFETAREGIVEGKLHGVGAVRGRARPQ